VTAHWTALIVLLASAITSQVALDGKFQRPTETLPPVTWLRSPELSKRVTLGFDSVLADVYWIRAVQYYGDVKLSTSKKKEYGLLYPLLDITTTLDPRFNIAYRFGAILLSEGYPNGAGNPDQAIALLQKGIREMPDRWQYYHDAGFVEYWWRHDYKAASGWLLKAGKLPKAPRWLEPTAAGMLARGGDRNSARALWSELAATSGQDWIRSSAKKALLQLDAEAVIEQLEFLAHRFFDARGRFPASWNELVTVGLLSGIPLDPSGMPYVIDSVSGVVDVAPDSPLFPLRRSDPVAALGR
jgi:hypothetical protein